MNKEKKHSSNRITFLRRSNPYEVKTKGHAMGITNLPAEQQAIWAKCFHPTGTFVEFAKEEVEQSIPDRFEKIVRMYPNHVAVKANGEEITYDALNRCANRLARAVIAQRGNGQEPVA